MRGKKTIFKIALLWFAALLPSESVRAQATHTLKPTPKTVAWGYYDAKAAPVLFTNPCRVTP